MCGTGPDPLGKEILIEQVVDLVRQLGLEATTKVRAAQRAWGEARIIDVVINQANHGKRLGVECISRTSSSSIELIVPSFIKDISCWPFPGIIVMNREDFPRISQGFLMSTGKVIWIDELEDWLGLYFN